MIAEFSGKRLAVALSLAASSLPGLTRQSIFLAKGAVTKIDGYAGREDALRASARVRRFMIVAALRPVD
jgi:hypothetical protein